MGPSQHYFNESKFQQDIEAVKAITSSAVTWTWKSSAVILSTRRARSWVDPVIDIREGPRYRIGRLEARGYTLFSRDEVLSPLPWTAG